MSKETHIQWCDSSNNPQMGCQGCELVKGQEINKCYAKTLVDRYKGLPGWPQNFETPKIFMDRVPKMTSWSDLTGQQRSEKPWLDGMPRLIFLNDMGDTFSTGMPKDWFKDVLPAIKGSIHQYLVLTKWPHRFRDFNFLYPITDNIWPGTTITSEKTLFRANYLTFGKIPWLSIEPLWGPIDLRRILPRIRWVVIGGESGINPTPCKIEWIQDIIDQCRAAGVPVFVKQLGVVLAKQLGLKDRSGGDWNEWPEHIKIREMPVLQSNLKYSEQKNIDILNQQQVSGKFHPYTCDRSHPDCEVNKQPRDFSKDGVLIATKDGWICPCGNYKQSFSKIKSNDND